MKSFRLDRQSVQEFIAEWPWWLVLLPIGLATAWCARSNPWEQIVIPLLLGLAIAPGLLVEIPRRYPTASCSWLLAVGMSCLLIGVTCRMAFPAWQSTTFDLCWLATSFVAILTFLLINRSKKNVV